MHAIIASFESLIEKNRSKAETQNEQDFKRDYLPKVVEVLNVLKGLQPLKRESCIAPMKKVSEIKANKQAHYVHSISV